MYGTIKQSHFEEDVSLCQLEDIDQYTAEPEENIYFTNAFNIAGCVLAFTSIYGVAFYLIYYELSKMHF